MVNYIIDKVANFFAPEYHLLHPVFGSLFNSKILSVVEAAQANMGGPAQESIIVKSI